MNSNWSYSPETKIWVVTSVTLSFDLWPWPFAWTLPWSNVITPENFMMIQWWEHSQKGVTDGQTDRQTDRRTENTIHRAAWSQLKICWAPHSFKVVLETKPGGNILRTKGSHMCSQHATGKEITSHTSTTYLNYRGFLWLILATTKTELLDKVVHNNISHDHKLLYLCICNLYHHWYR